MLRDDGVDFAKLKVMVIDDNRHFIAILSEMLRAFGVRDVSRFDNLPAAYEAITQRHFDIAFIDLNLGRESGLSFIQVVRSNPECNNRKIRFVVVSAYAEKEYVQGAIKAGADEFLVKPVAPRSVYDRVVRLVKRPLRYIRTESGYFGPDRRRAIDPNFAGFERRVTDDAEYV